MNLKIFIHQYLPAIVTVLTIVILSALKANGFQELQKRATLAIYFHGNPSIASQVADESLWTTVPNLETCDATNHRACMQLVEHTDLTSSGVLDATKIELGTMNTGIGFIPTRIGGTSATPFRPINRK
ncbi:hypothetical protein [Sphingobacterium kitahiroshimense]|uniref:Uncharacterized protein n=1 Tax=Sphingobacterium kitahiroshimense TaxID=470446 RepID=A0ABV0BP45_9SPHI